MLETIFFPNNAIHDGGVIIKGDRIAFAACIFP
jgi:DNA integrity scanning protein DisA with diadenylate cyclase activity